MLATYEPSVFSGLSNFCAARRNLEASRRRLPSIGKVITGHELEDTVGISLLHKHFEISPDERLLKTCSARGASSEPSKSQADFVPYSWKALRDKKTGQIQFFPTEFLADEESNKASLRLAKRLRDNEPFLSDIGAKLCELSMEDVFGITALPGSDIEVGPAQILLEETDEVNRTLTVAVVSENKVHTLGVDETLWTFSRLNRGRSDDAITALDCSGHCFGCCVSHGVKRE